jgi:cytochrome o ubiquinol oxidase subunit II
MRYGLVAVVLIGAATLGGCAEGVLDPKGPIALAEQQILLNSLGIMLAIVVPVILATLGVAFWFRASNERARYRPNFAYSGRLEMLVWSIPAMTVFLVGGVAWVGSHDLSPRKPIASTVKPLRVQVASLDWKWLFINPDQGVASVNYLKIPVGTPVSFELTSSGVMNSFFVPQLGSQIYTMAGMAAKTFSFKQSDITCFGASPAPSIATFGRSGSLDAGPVGDALFLEPAPVGDRGCIGAGWDFGARLQRQQRRALVLEDDAILQEYQLLKMDQLGQ